MDTGCIKPSDVRRTDLDGAYAVFETSGDKTIQFGVWLDDAIWGKRESPEKLGVEYPASARANGHYVVTYLELNSKRSGLDPALPLTTLDDFSLEVIDANFFNRNSDPSPL